MRAIISVSDKTGLVEFTGGLVALNTEIYATGGTLKVLQEAGLEVKKVSELTGFPEILDGRVKTLHPLIYAGILAKRSKKEHLAELERFKLPLIDMVVVNLYPFVETIMKPDVTLEEAQEQIDIGGPTLIRAAAKNYQDVAVVVNPDRYSSILTELWDKGGLSPQTRQKLAAEAFSHTATYDAHISSYFHQQLGVSFPPNLVLAAHKVTDLRYGENPHQQAAFYSLGKPVGLSIVNARQLSGKQQSFNNILDLDAAFSVAFDFSAPTVAIIKHGNPCGLASGDNLAETYRRAFEGDSVSAYGGIVGINRKVDKATAEAIKPTFYEAIVAPDYDEDALAILKTKKDLEIMQVSGEPKTIYEVWGEELDLKRVTGGLLAQTKDVVAEDAANLTVVTERHPTLEELTDLLFAWRAVKHVKSNAIIIARNLMVIGVGAGQMSRVTSVEVALRKAGESARRAVMASDAYFPFADSIEAAAKAGVTAIIQPGGSIRDEMAIKTANEHHMAMVFTGRRHFKH